MNYRGRQLFYQCPIDWSYPLNRGLVAEWAVLPTRFGGGGIRLRDIAKGNHGTLTNGPTWSGIAPPGGWGSLSFDGTNDVVTTALAPPMYDWTMSSWFRVNGPDNDILWSWNGGTPNVVALLYNSTSSRWGYQHDDTPGGVGLSTAYGWSYTTDSAWHHLALVQGNDVAPLLYLDGMLRSQDTTGNASSPLASALVLGGRIQASATWKGWLDRACFHARPLSAAEVVVLYDESRRGNPSRWNWTSTRAYLLPEAAGADTFTASVAATVGAATAAVSATFAPGTHTATIGATIGAATASASATFATGTQTASVSATIGGATAAVSASFAPGTHTASIAATVGAATASATASFSTGTHTAVVSATVGAATSAVSATFAAGTNTASIAATVGPATAAASAAFTPGTHTATVGATIGPAVAAVLAGFADFVAEVMAQVGAATASVTAQLSEGRVPSIRADALDLKWTHADRHDLTYTHADRWDL